MKSIEQLVNTASERVFQHLPDYLTDEEKQVLDGVAKHVSIGALQAVFEQDGSAVQRTIKSTLNCDDKHAADLAECLMGAINAAVESVLKEDNV